MSDFTDKYVSTDDSVLNPQKEGEAKKIILSNDAYAIAILLDNLLTAILRGGKL